MRTLKALYLHALYVLGPSTTTEIGAFNHMPRDSFSPRSVDLEAKGLITCVGRRPCVVASGGTSTMRAYDLTPKGRAIVAQVIENDRLRREAQ